MLNDTYFYFWFLQSKNVMQFLLSEMLSSDYDMGKTVVESIMGYAILPLITVI